jgi:replicative DNA helicase
MTKAEVFERLLSAEASIELDKIRDGTLNQYEWRRAADAASRIADSPLYVYDRRDLTPITLRAKLRRLKARHPDLALCIVDYLQLMVDGDSAYRVAETGKVSRALKVAAGDLEVPVLALSQLNRLVEHEKRRPRLSDLRDSGSLEQDADVVVFIHRDADEAADIAELMVKKNRHGEKDVFVKVSWRPQYTQFGDLAHERHLKAA